MLKGSIKFKDLRLLRKVRTLSFLNVLIGLMKKNLKLLIRSKSSALIVLLGPLLIIGLVGAAFNTTSFYNINIGTYSGYYNDLTLSILDELEDKDFTVLKVETKEDCISKVKRSELHVCAVFPDDLKVGMGDNVVFHVDKTRMNIVWVIMDSLSSKISSRSSELSKEMTNIILSALDETKNTIIEKETVLKDTIATGFEVKENVEGFSGSLDELDLEYSTSDLNLDSIKSELGSAISSAGASQESFDDVFDAISKTENISYSFAGKFSEARGKLEELSSNVGTIETSVSDNLYSMHQIASTLSGLLGKINTLEVTDSETIVTPIKTTIEPVIAEKTHLNNMFPTLIVLIVMFIGLLLASTLVVREKTGAAYFRNFITPTGDFMFLFGDYLTNFLVLFLQMAVVFGVSFIFFKEALSSVLFNAGVVLFLIISVFVMLGMLIGHIFSSEETNTLGAISIGSIFLFFSSTILPLETLPQSLRNIASFNPFVLGESMLKEVMLFNVGLMELLEPIVIVLVYILIFLFLVMIIRKVSKRFI